MFLRNVDEILLNYTALYPRKDGKLIRYRTMETYGGAELYAQHSLRRQYMKESGQLHATATLPWRRSPVTHWMGGLVGPRAGLETVE
jgi:hypothetical protein